MLQNFKYMHDSSCTGQLGCLDVSCIRSNNTIMWGEIKLRSSKSLQVWWFFERDMWLSLKDAVSQDGGESVIHKTSNKAIQQTVVNKQFFFLDMPADVRQDQTICILVWTKEILLSYVNSVYRCSWMLPNGSMNVEILNFFVNMCLRSATEYWINSCMNRNKKKYICYQDQENCWGK